MVGSATERPQDAAGIGEPQQERTAQANAVYKQICAEMGMPVCSWQDFNAWQEYVDEKIGKSQLAERARDELIQFSKTFGKYLVVASEDPKHAAEEAEKKERARRANKIYKKACTDSGLTACFFSNFSTWSEYVKGDMDETEFYDKAKAEVKKMLAGEAPVSAN